MANSYLLQMPPLVIEKILSNILNRANVSCACKALHEIVCHMETRKRVISIRRVVITEYDNKRLTIDDDGVFDSIMNSFRMVTNIQLDAHCFPFSYIELNDRQLERFTAITKRFGGNITSLMFRGIELPIDKIIEWLNQTPKLESLEFDNGKTSGSATTSLHLSSLKKISIINYRGLLEVVNLLPAGPLTYFKIAYSKEPEIIQTILSKQPNIKSLRIHDCSVVGVRRISHLQLEELELGRITSNNNSFFKILKYQTNLKELRLSINGRSPRSTFKWICDNFNELEVLHVTVNLNEKNISLMSLGELKKLRYFSTDAMLDFPAGQFKIDSLAKLKIRSNNWWQRSNEDFNQMVHSIGRTFTNITALDIHLKGFSPLSFVLSQCTTLILLTIHINEPSFPHQLAQKCFPNIRHLTILTLPGRDVDGSVTLSFVHALPNLKSLWSTTTKFNINEFKEFVIASKSLEDLRVDYFVLYLDLSATDDFVETIRRLSDQLKAYRLKFRPGRFNFTLIRDILSNEFNVQDDYAEYRTYSACFVLSKGVLSKFGGNL